MKYAGSTIRVCWLLAGICLLALLCTGGCSQGNPGQADRVLAKINTYELTLDEYETKLVRELEFDRAYKCTTEARKAFLDRLIRQEVLIQEAVTLDLDKQPEFIAAIEKYWEATLIKTLMEAKMDKVRQTTFITEDEIRARYDELKSKKSDLPPLDQVEQEISAILKEEKLTTVMDQWVTGLKKDAKIKVFEQYL